jgi:hypothetical protein
MKRKILAILVTVVMVLPSIAAPASAATQGQIDQAIQDGLAWLATQQNADGSFGSGYLLANTATAVLAFENEGHFPGGGTAYSSNAEKGLDYLLLFGQKVSVNSQTVGYPGRNDNPDTNGNGQGVYFSQNSYMYETGLVMQAIVASNTPDRVIGSPFEAIAADGDYSLALKADGSVVAWGRNDYGQANAPAGNDFVAIAAGYFHSLALKDDGSLIGWGYNIFGQANAPAGNDFVAVAAGYFHTPVGNDFVAIAAGVYHSLALRADGSLIGWGYNAFGQANAPTGNDFVAIAAGYFHSLALKADGSVVGWGGNGFGQASPPAGNSFVAVAAGFHHSLALKADGSVIGWGYNAHGQADAPAGNNFVAVAAGINHSLALKADGSVVGWGGNAFGQANDRGVLAGMTYREVIEDAVDFLAWAQIDGGPGRGGWRYGIFNNASGWGDNSVAQWPVLGLVAAEQWGISAPQFVKDELEHFVTYIQNANGGSGYSTPNDYINISKTGGLLVEFHYLGDDQFTARAQNAVDYINSCWGAVPDGWYGNKGHPYAMFSVFKGLELMGVTTIPSAPGNPETPPGDWWGDYSEYLVNAQNANGSWSGYWYWTWSMATGWYIVILQATVFPVSVDIVVPDSACDLTGYDVSVHYSVERFEADGTLTVYRDDVVYDTVVLNDFTGSATEDYIIGSDDVGSHTWKAVLNVTGGGITVSTEDSDTAEVYATPIISDIPDQFTPFAPIDLDSYLTACECTDVEWSASGVPAGWTVTIDTDSVAVVTAPEGATDPAEITFIATIHWPGVDCTDSYAATFYPNQPPVADAGRDYPEERYYVDEGGSVELDGTGSYDPDDSITSYLWDLDEDGEHDDAVGPTPIFSAALLDGPSHVYVYLKVTDEHGASDVGMARVEIANVAPTVDAITAPGDPVNINDQPISVVVDFSDPGIPDTHDVTWDWGDTSSDTQSGATSPASADHTYGEPGVYTVSITVTDDDGGSDTAEYQYIVVYDPSAGFVTGGGWIDSPEGAYAPDPSLIGKASFGFVSKYKKGATVPTGNTEFQFHAADLNFRSSAYDWLVVTGSDYTRFKGLGTINGTGSYKFMVWAGDDDPDTFRIKIWTEDDGGVETDVYDNGFDQTIAGGNIVIHDK